MTGCFFLCADSRAAPHRESQLPFRLPAGERVRERGRQREIHLAGTATFCLFAGPPRLPEPMAVSQNGIPLLTCLAVTG